MKVLFTTTLLIFTYFSSFSQEELLKIFAQDNQYLNMQFHKGGDSYKLDSAYYYEGSLDTWNLNYRSKTIKINSKGKNLEVIYHFWNEENNSWRRKDFLKIQYHNNNQIKNILRTPWNSQTKQWQDTTYFSEYDENDNELLYISKSWDYNQNIITQGRKYSRTFSNGLLISESYFTLDSTGKWYELLRSFYTYNDKGQNDTILTRFWNSYKWKENSKTIKEYNDAGKISQSLELIYFGGWKNDSRFKYIYDDSGNLTEKTFEKWKDSDWNYNSKYVWTYNQNNKVLSKVILKFTDDRWNNKYKNTYKYNSNNDITEYYFYIWNSEHNNWDNFNIYTVKYDDNNNKILLESKRWNTGTNKWENRRKTVYFWSEFNTDANQILSDTDFSIFPNPATDKILLKYQNDADLFLYNESGILLRHFANANEIDLSIYPKGHYYLKAVTDGKIIIKKIVKL